MEEVANILDWPGGVLSVEMASFVCTTADA